MHLNWRMPLSGPLNGVLPQPSFSADAFIQAQVFGRKRVAEIPDGGDQSIQASRIFRQQFAPFDVRAGTGTTVTRDAQGFIVASITGDAQAIGAGQVFGKHFAHQFPTSANDSQAIEANQIFGRRVDTTAALQLKLFGPIVVSSLTDTGLTASSAVATDANKLLVSVANSGSGSNVLANTPTLITPVLGVATATSINFGGLILANYEDPNWTPTDSSGAGLSITVTTARSTRIGRIVMFFYDVTYPATADASTAKLSFPLTLIAGSVGVAIASSLTILTYATGANIAFLDTVTATLKTNADLSGKNISGSGIATI